MNGHVQGRRHKGWISHRWVGVVVDRPGLGAWPRLRRGRQWGEAAAAARSSTTPWARKCWRSHPHPPPHLGDTNRDTQTLTSRHLMQIEICNGLRWLLRKVRNSWGEWPYCARLRRSRDVLAPSLAAASSSPALPQYGSSTRSPAHTCHPTRDIRSKVIHLMIIICSLGGTTEMPAASPP